MVTVAHEDVSKENVMDTIWLLDFDGVINANKPGWSAAPFRGNVYVGGEHYKIRWEPKLVARIRQVQKAGVLIFWASTWCGHTDLLEDLIKLPPLFSAGRQGLSGIEKRWAALDVLEAGNRLIWTDDEYVPSAGYTYDTMLRAGNALLIRPKSNRGLRPEHMDQIDSFIGA